MKSKLLQLALSLVFVTGFSLSVAIAQEERAKVPKENIGVTVGDKRAATAPTAEAKITQHQASNTALAQVPNGKITSAQLVKQHGKLVWSFDIVTPESKKVTNVAVDATTRD